MKWTLIRTKPEYAIIDSDGFKSGDVSCAGLFPGILVVLPTVVTEKAISLRYEAQLCKAD